MQGLSIRLPLRRKHLLLMDPTNCIAVCAPPTSPTPPLENANNDPKADEQHIGKSQALMGRTWPATVITWQDK